MSMILCCYTTLHPEVKSRLKGYDVTYADVSGDDLAYAHALQRYWGTEDLVLVEHDIGVRENTIEGLLACDRDWCTSVYQGTGDIYRSGMGCAKYSLALQQSITIADWPWWIMDAVFSTKLKAITPFHEHPEVDHFHDFSKPAFYEEPGSAKTWPLEDTATVRAGLPDWAEGKVKLPRDEWPDVE